MKNKESKEEEKIVTKIIAEESPSPKKVVEVISSPAPIKRKDPVRKIGYVTACDIHGVSSRMQFVVKRKVTLDDRRTSDAWLRFFKSERIVD